MGLATIQFYKNPYDYPKYTETLTPVGSSFQATPLGVGLKSGSMFLSGTMATFMTFNYMKIDRDGATIWAWVDDVDYEVDGGFTVKYSVDPWRTYKSKVTLGSQFITRSPQSTFKLDTLLNSTKPTVNVQTNEHNWATSNRVLVVQARPEPAYVANNTPVQPTPYHFYFAAYDPTNWQATQALVDLFTNIRASGAVTNIITVYSLPYMSLGSLPEVLLPIFEGDDQTATISGFKFLSGTLNVKDLLTRSRTVVFDFDLNELMRVPHSVQLLIPDAGIMSIPDEFLLAPNLRVRQDIDLFSGASNYMLTYGSTNQLTGISVRGSSTSSIPVISNPYDTYISQNQNALAVSLIGDVASVVAGAGSFLLAPNPVSAGAAVKGVTGLVGDYAKRADMKDMAASNPPSFLGTAMANHFHDKFFTIVKRADVSNESLVVANYGYPHDMVASLSFPSSGYVETKNCNVSGDGTVPRWALREINTMFDSGVLVV